MRLRKIAVLVLALVSMDGLAQQAVAPPPTAADNGPSLAVTMKYIADKLNGQGEVNYSMTWPHLPGMTPAVTSVLMSDAVADGAACTLNATLTQKLTTSTDTTTDTTSVGKYSVSFKDIKRVEAISYQEEYNRKTADENQKITLLPDVFLLRISSDKAVFVVTWNSTYDYHNGQPPTKDPRTPRSQRDISFFIADKDTADHLAKAMTHAAELCGANKEKDPFD